MTEIAFGHVSPSGSAAALDALLRATAKRLGRAIRSEPVADCEALAARVRAGELEVAWLPPIVFVEAGGLMTALGSVAREGHAAYEAALLVSGDGKIRSLDGLRGVKAGWVDRWSASGYVLPSVHLALHGFLPHACFASETFFGSHRAVIAALTSGACDVTATYAHADAQGNVRAGAWTEMGVENIRVLQTFGAIPPDVLTVRSDLGLEAALRAAFGAAFVDDPESARVVFGGTDLVPGVAPGYTSLRSALELAKTRGIFVGR